MANNNVYYILIAAKAGVAYKRDGETVLFDTRDNATDAAIRLRETEPDQHYLVEGPHTQDKLDWKARERARLSDGTYTPLIPQLDMHCLPDHFAHIGKGDPRTLAYTKTEADGLRDIQKVMNVSAYLKAYAPTLDRELVMVLEDEHKEFAGGVNLQLARTPEDIEEVYTNYYDGGGTGSSCMRYEKEQFGGHVHPVHAYGDSDLAVAYVSSGGETTARALVWPEKKVYSRMYGNDRSTPELQRMLLDAGYKASKGYYGRSANHSEHSLVGARLRAIVNEKGSSREMYVVPYVDEGNYGVLSEDGRWITIENDLNGNERVLSLKETGGTARISGPKCPSCRSSIGGSLRPEVRVFRTYPADPDQMQQMCEYCFRCSSFVCFGSGQRYYVNTVRRVIAGGRGYAEGWARENLPHCSCCNSYMRDPDELLPARMSLTTKGSVCSACAGNAFFWCKGADELTSNTIRLRQLDGTTRKKVAFGKTVKLIQRGHSALSPLAAERCPSIYKLAMAEMGGTVVPLCLVSKSTGMPCLNRTTVLTYSDLARAIGATCGNGDLEIVPYTEEIQDRVPKIGDWVKAECVLRLPDTDVKGTIIATDNPGYYTLVTPDGRTFYAQIEDVVKLPIGERPDHYPILKGGFTIGDRVVFNNWQSPRFGQTGVIEDVKETDSFTSYGVRFPDGSLRRASAHRIQPCAAPSQAELPLSTMPHPAEKLPHVWMVGDRVRFTPECVQLSISRSEIGAYGRVTSLSSNNCVGIVQADSGHRWSVQPSSIEYVEDGLEDSIRAAM